MGYQKVVKIRSELSHKIEAAKKLRALYPYFIFRFEFFSDLEMDPRTFGRYHQLQSGPDYPDFHLAYPIHGKHGLYIEAKREASDLYLVDGVTLKSDAHVQAQAAQLRKLQGWGYVAKFAIGCEGILEAVDLYLSEGV